MKRSGFTLLETAVAIVLLAVAGTICVQMLSLGAATRRTADQRRLAVREASNIMERLTAGPRDRLTAEAVETTVLSDEAIEALPDARLTVALDEPSKDGPPATRITITLAWQGRNGSTVRPVRLVAWHYGPLETVESPEDKP